MWNFEYSYLDLPNFFHVPFVPTTLNDAHILLFNDELANKLGIDGHDVFKMPKDAKPFAQSYGGYQFGHFNVLGDGRAAVLGEHIAHDGERFDVQIKGAGKTPFSRGADGMAALAPMLREYIISEFMHAIGIKTARSLYVATTGITVMRERPLIGATLARTASSHIRIGTFNLARIVGTPEHVKALADYTISRHFPEIKDAHNPYLKLLQKVAKLQAETVAKWMCVGFVHGVMNTDNALISGETIDYWPCAFLDIFDPNAVFSSIDAQGRYKYQNQPIVAGWNIIRFAESLEGLVPQKDIDEEIENFAKYYEDYWLKGMCGKIGLKDAHKDDAKLINELLSTMYLNELDFTNTFLDFGITKLNEWRAKWLKRLKISGQTEQEALDIMHKNNPAIIPRNHQVEHALAKAEEGDLSYTISLVEALKTPYIQNEKYAQPPQKDYKCTTFCGT